MNGLPIVAHMEITKNRSPKLISIALVAALLLGGCASTKGNFTCPVPDGAKCLSTTEVYERTNFSETLSTTVTPRGATRAARQGADTSALVTTPSRAVAGTRVQNDALAIVPIQQNNAAAAPVAAAVRNAAEPHRDPAQVLQVWVGPYEDEAGRLHMPTRIFVEIEPRRWNVGHKAVPGSAAFALLETPGQGAAQDGQGDASASAELRRPGMAANQPQ
mgnify:CR=1 FL=1